ncbi:transposase [Novosphingobium indicum]|uniref:Transposase n=1 Tax=Novosphingobium indicum TaxID=462949 RepID=A0ABQ2K285_9SPHN|nr:ISNCY family transposase [Novosphingobium indicum]GGN63356.1 transposase [Novosphingobium indicum]
MRQKRIIQSSLFDLFADHQIGRELKAISGWLDAHPELLPLLAADLGEAGIKDTGRQGLPVESVLRCAVLKQYRQLSYEELAFHLEDSCSFRAFARLPLALRPKKSVLQKTISRIGAQTWEQVNQALLRDARQEKLERGTLVRIDSTVCEALMHAPSDSSLLCDSVRVMTRLLKQAASLPGGTAIVWRNRQRLARKRALAIRYSRGKDKKARLYRDLIDATQATMASLRSLALHLGSSIESAAWRLEVEHYLSLIERVIDQSRRRVFAGERVPTADKLVSLFEPHAEIIVKGGRDVQYGHKLNFSTGKSGMILDVVIEDGNPADAARFLPMLERHVAMYGEPPRQSAADGGFASRDNLKQAKAIGVRDVAFHKKCGLRIEDMAKSKWVYRQLRNFRAGIEAGISCLKRAYGLTRCTWRGIEHFKSYVWSSVVANNLAIFARLKPT